NNTGTGNNDDSCKSAPGLGIIALKYPEQSRSKGNSEYRVSKISGDAVVEVLDFTFSSIECFIIPKPRKVTLRNRFHYFHFYSFTQLPSSRIYNFAQYFLHRSRFAGYKAEIKPAFTFHQDAVCRNNFVIMDQHAIADIDIIYSRGFLVSFLKQS